MELSENQNLQFHMNMDYILRKKVGKKIRPKFNESYLWYRFKDGVSFL